MHKYCFINSAKCREMRADNLFNFKSRSRKAVLFRYTTEIPSDSSWIKTTIELKNNFTKL